MHVESPTRSWALGLMAILIILLAAGGNRAAAQLKQPNIVIIWGDDIGQIRYQRLFAWD